MSAAPTQVDTDADGDEDETGGGRRRLVVGIVAGVLVLAVIALLVVGLVNRDVGTSIDDALAAGERPEAPDFTLPLLVDDPQLGPAGTEVSLSELRGSPVVVNFWASWCVPCEAEAPILEQVWNDYRDRGVVVLGVDTQDLTDEAKAFLRETGTTYPSVRDGTDGTQDAYQLTGVPETLIVDADGRIALRVIGQLTQPEQLETPLEQVL
jgi:cytochrome c biogenesis protein CcmG/thiol:disulfide interchange protein DsbE